MTALENRLRHALTERADQSAIDPDAWDKTLARSRRRIRLPRPRWFAAGLVIPAAAAAAVVAIVVASTALTGGLFGSHGVPGQHSTRPATATQAGPPGQDVLAVRDIPPVTRSSP